MNLGKLISSLDLINCLWLKLRANKPIITLMLETRCRNRNGSFLIFLIWAFFGCCCCWRKYWRLRMRGMINKNIITLQINWWKRHYCWYLKSWYPLPISIGHLSLKMLPDSPHFDRFFIIPKFKTYYCSSIF